jgi:hypothetical protein
MIAEPTVNQAATPKSGADEGGRNSLTFETFVTWVWSDDWTHEEEEPLW